MTSFLFRLLDVAVLAACMVLAYFVRLGEFNPSIAFEVSSVVVFGALILASYVCEAVEIDLRVSRWRFVGRFVLACIVALGLVVLFFYLSALRPSQGGHGILGRGILLPAFVATACVGGAVRWFAYGWARHVSSARRWLMIGKLEGNGTVQFKEEVCKRVISGEIRQWEPVTESYVRVGNGGAVPASTRQLAKDLFAESWTGILLLDGLSIPAHDLERLMQARLGGTPIYTLAEFYEEMWRKVPVLHLDHHWFAVTGGFGLLHEPIHRRVKRLCDISIATLVGLLATPLLLLGYVYVRLMGGRGSVIYKQIRLGQDGKCFTIYKLRSMRADSESSGIKWASKNDPRVIPLGGLMRKFRIDELPQLWNIIRGDMSFIGPRPERPEFAKDLEAQIPFFSLRLLVKPGLTGWAQVNYPYGASVDDAREKLEYDLYYIKHQSFWLDLRILFRTFKVITRGFGGR